MTTMLRDLLDWANEHAEQLVGWAMILVTLLLIALAVAPRLRWVLP